MDDIASNERQPPRRTFGPEGPDANNGEPCGLIRRALEPEVVLRRVELRLCSKGIEMSASLFDLQPRSDERVRGLGGTCIAGRLYRTRTNGA